MYRSIRLIACLLLLTIAATQNCSNSQIPGIASGIVRLGVSGTPATQVAQTAYSLSLAEYNLGTFAKVFHAFAVAGIQASSTQTYYSLVVDQVVFSNGNTQMNFTMSYANPDGSFQTTWSSIKLSWVAISTLFEKVNDLNVGGQYVWAGSVGLSNPTSGTAGAVIANSIWRDTQDQLNTCGYTDAAVPYFDMWCGSTDYTLLGNQRFLTHTYIMGFQFNPTGGNYVLGASALIQPSSTTGVDMNEALVGGYGADFTFNSLGDTSANNPNPPLDLNGPNLLIDSAGSQLTYIKIGIVITVILDITTYTTANPATTFQYAGIYMPYTLYNTAQPIIHQTSQTAVGSQNYNYYDLLKAKYQIYGLSSFFISNLDPAITVINYEVTVGPGSQVLFQTDDVNYMTSVRVAADQWSHLPQTVCGAVQATIERHNPQFVASSVPALQNSQQNVFSTPPDLKYDFFVSGSSSAHASSPLSAVVSLSNLMTFNQITPNAPYKIEVVVEADAASFQLATTGTVDVSMSIKIEGNEIKVETYNIPTTHTTGSIRTGALPLEIGYTFLTATPTIEIDMIIPRDINSAANPGDNDRTITVGFVLTKYSHAYNPLTDCCNATCPAGSGVLLGVGINPPVCQVCATGQFFNSVTRACECQTGHYEVIQVLTNEAQCFACYAPLCQSCNATSREICNSCVTGAATDANGICTCQVGFYQNGTTACPACPVKCASCSVGTVCLTCSDNATRDSNNNCECIAGYYSVNTAVCVKCPALCQTCSSATTCLSCNTANNRALVNGQCVCATGFFQVVNADGSLSCSACDPSCEACSLTADRCTNCKAADNRILGYDSTGAQVCNCLPGYHPNSNNFCVQSNCASQQYCATCLTVLGVNQCINCIAATHRTLVLPAQTCNCMDGFHDVNGICTPCGQGCAKCTNANTCVRCVATARNMTAGTCTCPSGFFFAVSPVRFCKRCANYTLTCKNIDQALTCQTNFTLTNGKCTCPTGRYINTLGQCQPCVTGCASCNSSTSCLACNRPLLLQSNTCVARCGPGYFQNGFVCTACSPGCAMCKGPNICLICLAGQLSYNGFCHRNCPAGSVKSNSSSCVECNSPCKTCTEHPSKCTSCLSCCGNLFNFKCPKICPVGTYAINNTCQYCAYNCKTCLGSNTTCTSCPTGKILYSGACYDKCPYIMIGGVCTFKCANGLYKTAMNDCAACSSQCLTCEGHPSNCTTCKAPLAAHKGVCVSKCPPNYLALDNKCKACNPECKGCVNNCDNCIDCAVGYYKLGSSCVKTCYPNMFVDNTANVCVQCSDTCKTCSSLSFCTTCANPQAVPVNGVCNDCSYPCDTCSTSPSTCTACVTGFNLIGTTCIAACPTGAYPKNGVCVCTSGYLFSNACVNRCPEQYGNIGGMCQKCAPNCASCERSKDACTLCMNGYALDQVSGLCQKAPSCQFGQYFSQTSNSCDRICPQNTYFYENVCLTACLSGFNDNGVGGCVAATPATGCSFPYFLSNGVCVSNCPSGTYPDTENRLCKSCSSNCFSCLTNTFCYACNAGYDLNKGICIAATLNCPAGEFRYNGVCYRTCPAGTCEQGSFCQRTCPAGTWAYNGGCYRTCPTKLTTADACVDSCPSGTSLVNGVCQVGSQTCPSGQYWDGTSSSCLNCKYPCSQCQLTASFCTACSAGLTLSQNLCVSTTNNCGQGRYKDSNGNCQQCPAKCAECISGSICSACASTYNFDGKDCVKAIGQLKSLVLTRKSTTKRGNTAFITICPNILPNGLSPQQQNNFFTVLPNNADAGKVSFINQWLSTVDNGCVTVGVNYNSFPASSAVFLAVNAKALASSYLSIGYKADASSFVSVPININLPQTPANVVPPSNAVNTFASTAGQVDAITKSIIRNSAVANDILG